MVLKVLKNISLLGTIIGSTLLISKGFVYKVLAGCYTENNNGTIYISTIWKEFVNLEGILITSISLVLYIAFLIAERRIKK